MDDKNYFPFNYDRGLKIVDGDCIVIKVNPLEGADPNVLDKIKSIDVDLFKPFCTGYVVVPTKTVPQSWTEESVVDDFVDAPGGLTYFVRHEDYVIFGFDRSHYWDLGTDESGDMEKTMEMTKEFRKSVYAGIRKWKTENPNGRFETLELV